MKTIASLFVMVALLFLCIPVTVAAAAEVPIFNNGNVYGVENGPTSPTTFSLTQPHRITSITNYHWNAGRGQRGGTITVRSSDGQVYGPWPVGTTAGQGGAPNVSWRAEPNVVLPAGTYTVIDSDPGTWSRNSQSQGKGFSDVRGIPQPRSVSQTSSSGGASAIGPTIFSNGNIYGVANGPTSPTRFTIPVPMVITSITNYHWNSGKGQRGGTIALRSTDGRTFGPWPVATSGGQGGAPNVYWKAEPDVLIPAGTYTVVDSDPATWSQNSQSRGQGFCEIHGIAPEGETEPGPAPDGSTGESTGEHGGRENVLDSKQATIGAAGGRITLSDGASISVEAGAVTGESRIVFKKIGKDAVFAGAGVTAYDFTAKRYPSEYTLNFPVAKGLSAKYISILNYDPDQQEVEIIGDTVDFAYDAAAGLVTVKARPDKIATLAPMVPIDRSRWVVTQAPPVPSAPKPPVQMAFYQQDDLTCYASCLKMMVRAYRPSGREQIYDFMKALGYDEKTGPSGVAYWIYKIPTQLKVATGQAVTSGAYYFISSALNNLVTQLDKGIPVMVGRAGHSIIVAGYRKDPGQTDPATFKWLVQDPSGDHTPNYWADAAFITKNTMAFEVWALQPPPSPETVQSVGLPLSPATGWLMFYKAKPADENQVAQDVPVAGLGFAIGKTPEGYGWKVRAKTGTEIPSDASKLVLHLPLWNTAATGADVRLDIEVKPRNKQGKSFKESVPTHLAAGVKSMLNKEIPVGAFASGSGPLYRLEANLFGADGRNIDGFAVDFSYSPELELTWEAPGDSTTAKFEVSGSIPAGASFIWDFGDGRVETTKSRTASHTYDFEWPADSHNPFEFPEVKFKASVEVRDSSNAVIGAPAIEVAFSKGVKVQPVH